MGASAVAQGPGVAPTEAFPRGGVGSLASRVARVAPTSRPKLRLVVLSFLMLFVELALIRWTGSNVVYLSYFSNFVLLGSFLGIGAGFLRTRSKVNLFRWSPVGLGLLVLFVSRFPVKIDRSGSGLLFFGEFTATGLPIWATLPIVFVAVAAVMAMIAEGVARQFARFEPLEAYRLDILGSILGIAGFASLAFAHAPPIAWGVVVALAYAWLFLAEARGPAVAASLVAGLVLLATLGVESADPHDRWSPYYKIHLEDLGGGATEVKVNGIPHQVIRSTADRRAGEGSTSSPTSVAPTPPRPARSSSSARARAATSPSRSSKAPSTWTPSRSIRASTRWDGSATPTTPTTART